MWLEEKALAENAAKTGAKRPSEVNTRESGSPGLASGPSSDERRGRGNEDYSDAASYSESVSGAALMKAASRERSLMASKSKKKVSNAAPILPFGASDAETKEYERALSAWLEEKALAEKAAKTGAKRGNESY